MMEILRAFELKSPYHNLLSIPNIHVIVFRNQSNIMVGECLDFGLIVHSEEENEEKAFDSIVDQIWTSSIIHLFSYYENENLDKLYNMGEEIDSQSKWGKFNALNNLEKIEKFKNSLDRIQKNPDELRILAMPKNDTAKNSSKKRLRSLIKEVEQKESHQIDNVIGIIEKYLLETKPHMYLVTRAS